MPITPGTIRSTPRSIVIFSKLRAISVAHTCTYRYPRLSRSLNAIPERGIKHATLRRSESRRRVEPKDTRFLPSDVPIGVGPLRTKMETVAFTQAICAPGDIKLNLALKHISELFSFVLNQTFAASARFDMINV